MAQTNGSKRSPDARRRDNGAQSSQDRDRATKPKERVTFASQDKLQKLPIPDLDSSLQKYLSALQPLQSAKEHRESRSAIKDFLRSDGPDLHEKLKKYAEGKSNYIEQFWYDSYLNYDNPVVLNLNPFFLLEDDPTPARNNQVTRAASLVISALEFVRAVRREELQPDNIRGQPLCMYQYSRLFGTARIPTEDGCHIGQDPDSTHIVVMCQGQFYYFDVLDENSDVIMTEKDVSLNLQVIVDDAAQVPIQEAAKGAVGVLSTENRKTWSGLRDVLQREEGSNNSDCLNIVDSALFILCLDYTEPQTGADLCMNMLCGSSQVERGVQVGTCTNRWYDKLQIIVCKNGSAGINFEHTGVDGHTVLRFASDVYTDTILRFAKTINGQAPSLWTTVSPDPSKRDPDSFGDLYTTPHKLEWEMVPELSTALRFAETRLADLIAQNEFETLEFQGYGKNFMTSMGFSPDAFVQMAFQAAYYGLYGRAESVYEPAMTKFFYHGRTEAVRSVTMESLDFVQTFWGENPAAKKVDALRKACEKHVKITRESAKAQGHDRHLYALYCIWQRSMDEDAGIDAGDKDSQDDSSASGGSPSGRSEDAISATPHAHGHQQMQALPALFADAGWDKLTSTILSTSNCGNPSLRQFGFGPTTGEGFGIGYIIKDGSVSICASSKHRQTRRYIAGLEAYFVEIRKLLRQTVKKGEGVDKTRSQARVAEESRPKGSRMKSRGRKIGGGGGGSDAQAGAAVAGGKGQVSVEEDMEEEDDDDGLGGYGFFDAGMLLQALKKDDAAAQTEKQVPGRREVGRKLLLAEY